MLDFWDLGKLLGRRWRISLPLLILTIASSVLIFMHVKPDYVATAYVQLVPPVPVAVPPGKPQPAQRNPWLLQDLKALGNAALISVQDASYAEALKATGYADSFTATVGDSTPLITFQVTGKSIRQAGGTTDQLINRFNESLVNLQTPYGVAQVDLITARRLDAGTNIAESNSSVKRAFIAVAAAGLLLTFAITVAVDAWLRRRRRLKASGFAGSSAEPAVAHADGPRTNAMAMTRIFAASTGPTTARGPSGADTPRTQQAFGRGDSDSEVSADATVVLPKAIADVPGTKAAVPSAKK